MKTSLKNQYKYHGRLLGWGSSPEADWQVMFSLFIILLLIISSVSVVLFYEIKNGSFGFETSAQVAPVSQTALHKTAVFYEGQKLNFAKYQSLPETTPDPSL